MINVLLIHTLICQTNQYRIYNDLSYLSKEDISVDSLQKLNLVLPERTDKYPLLIWIGGGAWSYVDRHQEMDFARKLATKGIGVASIGHRLSPAIWRDPSLNKGVQHPRHIEDLAASIKWLYQNADKYGYDEEGLFVGGYSSGGHLAALIYLDSTYLTQIGLTHRILKGMIPISGTYDIVNYHKVLLNSERSELAKQHVEAVFGSKSEDHKKASPTNYLQNLSIPVLLISDNNVYNYSKLFEEKVRATEFRNMQVVYAYDLSHGELWRDLSFSENSIYRTIIVDFIEAKAGNG